MKNFAYSFLDGYLTSDPEIKSIPGGKKVTSFSIAVNHTNRNEGEDGEVSYFDVEAWDKLGENCAEYLKKGRLVTVMGNIKQDRWKSQDGNTRQRVKIVANTVRFDSFGQGKKYEEERKAA